MRVLTPLLMMIILPILLTACQPASSDEGFVVADLFDIPGRDLATVELSPTFPPSATDVGQQAGSTAAAPTLPLPTVVILDQPTLPIGTFGPTPTSSDLPTATPEALTCTTEPDPLFVTLWQTNLEVQTLVGCAVGPLQPVTGVYQQFEHGVMFWRENDRSIFAISLLNIRQGQNTDSWWRLNDTFTDGEPESDPSLQPPAGLLQPVRGFGKVWRENAFIRDALGWATADETGGTSQWQQYEKGWLMTGLNNNPIYVMVPLDDPPYTAGIHPGPLP